MTSTTRNRQAHFHTLGTLAAAGMGDSPLSIALRLAQAERSSAGERSC